MKFPFYKQLDLADCGPTCLRMVSKFYRKEVSLNTIRKNSLINRSGVSLHGIASAAEKIGFKTLCCKITFDQLLEDAPKPCIVHWNQNHFVVITPSANKKSILVADPAEGICRLPKKEFLRSWISFNDGELVKGAVLLLEPGISFHEDQQPVSSGLGWSMFLKYLFRYKKQFFQLFLGFALGCIVQLAFPFLTQSIVDTGITMRNLSFIKLILIAQVALFFSQTVIEFIKGRIMLYISSHVNLSILSDFWVKLMSLPMSFFDTKHFSDLIQRITDHKRIESFLTTTAFQSVFSVMSLVVLSFILITYNPSIYLIFLLGSVLHIIWIRVFLQIRKNLDYKSFGLASKEMSASMQLIYGMQEIKLNNAEKIKRWNWEGIQAEVFNLRNKALSVAQYQETGSFFISHGKNIIISYLVAKSVVQGELSLGSMLAVQFVIGQLNGPFDQLSGIMRQYQDAKISLERLNDIHTMDDEDQSNKVGNVLLTDDADINIKNLTFAYPGAEATLKNISVEFLTGKVTAIVGISGSGKTTLLKLLQGFYSDFDGEIKIGQAEIRSLSPHYWRSITGSVMQEAFIFSDTIENNIAVGDENPDFERIITACKIANILDFIQSLPLGLNTKIGSEGNGISQGQRQRILIARAVYKNPKFLFFDEATNSLDANNEKIIMENLNKFFHGKTVIVVAHRLSTVKNANNIIVLENGRIAESGDHQELTSKRGLYYELVKNQLEMGL